MSGVDLREDRCVRDAQVGDAVHAKVGIDDAPVLEGRHAARACGVVQCVHAFTHPALERLVVELANAVVQVGVAIALVVDHGRDRLSVGDLVEHADAPDEDLHVVVVRVGEVHRIDERCVVRVLRAQAQDAAALWSVFVVYSSRVGQGCCGVCVPQHHCVQTECVLARASRTFHAAREIRHRGCEELDVGSTLARRPVLWFRLRRILTRREQVEVVASDERCSFTNLHCFSAHVHK